MKKRGNEKIEREGKTKKLEVGSKEDGNGKSLTQREPVFRVNIIWWTYQGSQLSDKIRI